MEIVFVSISVHLEFVMCVVPETEPLVYYCVRLSRDISPFLNVRHAAVMLLTFVTSPIIRG